VDVKFGVELVSNPQVALKIVNFSTKNFTAE